MLEVCIYEKQRCILHLVNWEKVKKRLLLMCSCMNEAQVSTVTVTYVPRQLLNVKYVSEQSKYVLNQASNITILFFIYIVINSCVEW